MDFINKNLRGILFCFALAVPATYLGKLFPVVGAPVFVPATYLGKLFPVVGAPVFAILFGLAAAFWKRPAFFQPGNGPHFFSPAFSLLPKKYCNIPSFF